MGLKNIEKATLLVSCTDRKGLVAAMANLLHEIGANITQAHEHLDQGSATFFQRVEFELENIKLKKAELKTLIGDRCKHLGMRWQLHFSSDPRKVALLVSKPDHCLYDLLYRHHSKEFEMDISCVISNHCTNEKVANMFSIPFHYEPVSTETKQDQEKRILQHLRQYGVNLVVLARYMQILSKDFLAQCDCPIINIHHSFLPAFVGKNPYHKAYERGVKLIGATAHYVTPELDEGPIIEQDIIRVTHRDTPQDMVCKGRDIEKMILSKAVRLHLEDRIFIHGNKTIVIDR